MSSKTYHQFYMHEFLEGRPQSPLGFLGFSLEGPPWYTEENIYIIHACLHVTPCKLTQLVHSDLCVQSCT